MSSRTTPFDHLRTFAADTTRKLGILGHDGDTLGVNGTQVGIFKETDKVGLGSFLESQDGRALETEITLEILGNLTHEALEGELADQKISRLLVTTNLTKSNRTGAVTVGLLDTASGGR